MKSTLYIALAFLITIVFIPEPLHADMFEKYGLRPGVLIVADGSRATFDKAREIAVRGGARGLLLLPPKAIFGRFPEGMGSGDFAGLSVTFAESAREVAPDEAGETYRAISGLFNESHFLRETLTYDPGPIDHGPLIVPYEEISDDLKGRIPRMTGSSMEIVDRGIQQNSEFMMGTVTINVVLPETFQGGSETWQNEEIENMLRDLLLGLSQYQQHAHWVDLAFLVNMPDEFKRVVVQSEPIENDMNTDAIWIMQALESLGYGGSGYHSVLETAHLFNNDERSKWNTDWVFTAFVADASENECWQGPQGNYSAYAYLGGPYIVIPYPACGYGTGIGFSKVFIHEMSHIFWALDEYEEARSLCSERSGYLNVRNGNSFFNDCGEGMACIMDRGLQPEPLPICMYTLGQVGLADDNGNSIPDLYELAPYIAIQSKGTTDTTFTGVFDVKLNIINDAVENRNPVQENSGLPMIDYAPPIKRGWWWINNGLAEDFSSVTIPGNLSHVQVWMIEREGLTPGENEVHFVVENVAGLRGEISHTIYFIGVRYFSNSVTPGDGCFDIEWLTGDELFGADFEITRKDLTVGTPFEFVAQIDGDDYDSWSEESRKKHFQYTDHDIVSGREYIYRISASFEFPPGDPNARVLQYTTRDMYEIARIPVPSGKIISNVLPNPTNNGRISFTIDVPETVINPSGSKAASAPKQPGAPLWNERTQVDIKIYNVRGQKVRDLYSRLLYAEKYTKTWDGLDDRGKPVSPGVYFLRVSAGETTEVKKVVVLR